MTAKNIVKILVDAAILCLMLGLISYPLIQGLWRHAMMGCAFACFFAVHQLLNRWWYQALWQERWTLRKAVWAFVDFLLIADVLVLITSAVLLAGEVFSFAAFPMTNWARRLHVCTTAWAFVLVGLHLGFHGKKFWKRFKEELSPYGFCAMSVMAAIGAVMFVESEMIWDLLYEEEMKLLPETLCEFVVQRLSVVMLFCVIGRSVSEMLQILARKKREHMREKSQKEMAA